MKLPSKKALDLILEYEVGGGKSYYDKFLARPTWPGGASGFTLGIGVDCAYYTTQELEKLFYFLPEKQLEIVKNASGKKGLQGKEYTQKYKNSGINVTWEQAISMFNELTWSKFSRLAEKTYPELDNLCDDAYGAIVSLVFNRGSSLVGDSRLEMRKIKNLIPQKNYKEIAKQIRDMKRLWVGKNLDGLLSRREDEAKLVESCM
jgi:GH24 family phage-related lysozyme (muramidase)